MEEGHNVNKLVNGFGRMINYHVSPMARYGRIVMDG
jgi:hypothetical protein